MTLTVNQILIAIILFLILAILVVGFMLFIYRAKGKKSGIQSLKMKLFLISLPRGKEEGEGQGPKSEKEIISAMEQLYSGLVDIRDKEGGLLGSRPHMVFEIAVAQETEEIAFYLAVPENYQEIIEKQIQSIYPDADISEVEDYTIFSPQGKAAAAYLKLGQSAVLPFKTYQYLEVDPLKGITNALSKIKENQEGAALQIVFRPTTNPQKALTEKVIKEMQKGKSFSKAYAESGGGVSGIAKTLKGPKSQSEETTTPTTLTSAQEEAMKAIENKLAKPVFQTNVRIVTGAETQGEAEVLLNEITSTFVQFGANNLNKLKVNKVTGRRLRKLIYNFSFRLFNKKESIILGVEELSSLFHLSIGGVQTPNVKYLKSKNAPAPASLPQSGLLLGKNIYRGEETQVRMQEKDRQRHFYVIGQTGTGKTNFLKNLITQDIRKGEGVGVLDPHGDLIEEVLEQVPKERADDVILVDPGDLDRPIGMNMLDYNSSNPEQKTFVVNELINIFDKLYDLKQTGGPMFEQYARNALLLLMDDPEECSTLMEVLKVLSDTEFRNQLLEKCQNPTVKDFWEKEAQKAGGDAALANIVPYITSKFNVFTTNDYMRPIIGQRETAFNFRDVMDNRKIVLVNLSKGKLGESNSALLGLIIVGKILMASFSRVDMPEEERAPFYLYMDEFQNFATDSISTILSEARKYRLSLTLVHQFIGQLTEEIRDAVFGNVGSMAAMRIGADDAEFMEKQFEPVFDQNDLMNLDNFKAYLRLMINNQTSRPFNVSFYPPEAGNAELAQKIKKISSYKYGLDRKLVEEDIKNRL